MDTLVIITHPSIHESRINAHLKKAIMDNGDITVHELYREYPDENIDVKKEQRLLKAHDRIIFQFPNYWYSYPPLLKKWFDEVLEAGWAFKGQFALRDKEFGIAISSAFSQEDYRFDGVHRHTIEQIMAPFYATCTFIRAKTMPLFKTFEDEVEDDEQLFEQGLKYIEYLRKAYPFDYHS